MNNNTNPVIKIISTEYLDKDDTERFSPEQNFSPKNQSSFEIMSDEFLEFSPTKLLQKKLKQNYRSVPKLQIHLSHGPSTDALSSAELDNIFSKKNLVTPRKTSNKEIYPHLYQLSGLLTSLICITGYGYWMLIHEILNLSSFLSLSILGISTCFILGYGLDQLAKDELSLLRTYRFMTLALEINIFLTAISAEFLINTGLSSPLTIFTTGLITTALSAIMGIAYDINMDREHQKYQPVNKT